MNLRSDMYDPCLTGDQGLEGLRKTDRAGTQDWAMGCSRKGQRWGSPASLCPGAGPLGSPLARRKLALL